MKKIFLFLVVLLSTILVSCTSMIAPGLKDSPYSIKGEMKINEGESENLSEFVFEFKNCSAKEIHSFVVSFFLFDEEGNPLSGGVSNVSCIIRKNIAAGEILCNSFGLDNFLSEVPEKPYKVEYLFVKRIVFEDGTEWNDPFGFKSL
ncbi:MAG: hypothetical protein MJ182_04415 [Treponema sp.]|nr:hypothetical protein [Treponema sp.]